MYCRPGHVIGAEPYRGVQRVLLPAMRSFKLETVSHGLPASIAARLRRHDVVFVVNIANVPYCLVARVTGQRIVLSTDGQEWLRGKWGRGARAYWRLCARLAGRSTSALIADSVAMRDIYRRQFNADSSVIPYCWTELRPAEEPSTALGEFSVEPHRYFVVAARFNPENNVTGIVDAYVRSAARYPLLVLGAANYRSPVYGELETLGRSCPGVRIGGHVEDRTAFATLVAYSAAYLHGHSVGGINPSLIEAMGCGANVIALGTPFNEETLGGTGTCFSDFRGELPELLEAAEAEPPPAGALRREAARCRAREVFSVGAVAAAHEELFQEVASRSAWATTSMSTMWDNG